MRVISEFLDLVRDEIYLYTGLPVVDTDDTDDRPDYPFYSYKVTTYIPERHTGLHQNEPLGKDIKETLGLNSSYSLSFNAYHSDLRKANDLAMTAWEWFRYIGERTLDAYGYVITNVMAVNDRTFDLSDKKEYRYGFDVTVRFLHKIERTVTTIETWTINKGE